MGNMSEAIKYLQMYIEAEDSLKIANEQMASSEFATCSKWRNSMPKKGINAPGTGKGDTQ